MKLLFKNGGNQSYRENKLEISTCFLLELPTNYFRGLVAEKSDESLFFVDKSTEGDQEVCKRRFRPLRCYANLEPDPNTTAAVVPRQPLTTKKLKEKMKTLKEIKAEEQRRKSVRQEKLKHSELSSAPLFDLWSANNVSEKERVDGFHLEYTKKRRVKLPKHYHEKTSEKSAVSIPHPGSSYNPAFDDHQELLSKALQVELKKERAEKKIERSLDAKFPSRDEAPTEETWLDEMSAGLFEDEEGEQEEDLSQADDRLSVNPAVRREDKKTRRQRRLEKERKTQEKAQILNKEKKKRSQDLVRLKSIKSQIKERENELLQRQKKKTALKTLYKDKPKKLGKLKFEEPEIEIKLCEELPGSLRELKPEGHLLEDRFKALQRRNIIETRKRAKYIRKYRPKKFEKKGHKAVMI